MNNKNHLTLMLALLGVTASIILVYKEITLSNYCPRVFDIPACYLVLLSFILVLGSIVFNNKYVFGMGTSLGLILAIWFSYNQLIGKNVCPVFANIPLCYVSLLTFMVIIILDK